MTDSDLRVGWGLTWWFPTSQVILVVTGPHFEVAGDSGTHGYDEFLESNLV